MTGVILDLDAGGLRELHWHPNADEWQYVVSGDYSVTLFGSHGRYRTETLSKGDVAYIPQGYGHSIENIGGKPGRILIGLNTGNYGTHLDRPEYRKLSGDRSVAMDGWHAELRARRSLRQIR
jgi:oxalate decarboxylase